MHKHILETVCTLTIMNSYSLLTSYNSYLALTCCVKIYSKITIVTNKDSYCDQGSTIVTIVIISLLISVQTESALSITFNIL